jgi:hypothetical protein
MDLVVNEEPVHIWAEQVRRRRTLDDDKRGTRPIEVHCRPERLDPERIKVDRVDIDGDLDPPWLVLSSTVSRSGA